MVLKTPRRDARVVVAGGEVGCGQAEQVTTRARRHVPAM